MVNSWRIKIQRAAKEDLRSGYEFYNAQEFGLGDYFYDCLMSDIDALAYYGGVHRQYHGFYKALSSRFPYAIYYKLSEGFVKVYAVLDTRRKPARNDARGTFLHTTDRFQLFFLASHDKIMLPRKSNSERFFRTCFYHFW